MKAQVHYWGWARGSCWVPGIPRGLRRYIGEARLPEFSGQLQYVFRRGAATVEHHHSGSCFIQRFASHQHWLSLGWSSALLCSFAHHLASTGCHCGVVTRSEEHTSELQSQSNL